jgi:primosomal protein N' (replication factor Y) (superfamily II helicase)
MILAVAIDTPLRLTFDYLPPPDVALDAVQPGQRVWVSFGRRRTVGVVVELRSHSELPLAKLRAAQSLIDDEPTFDPKLLELLTWSAEYYRHPVGEVMAAALPVMLRHGAPLFDEEVIWRLTALGRDQALAQLPQRARRQREVVASLLASGESAARPEDADALRKLAQRGYVERYRRTPPPVEVAAIELRGAHELSPEQRVAVDRLRAALGTFASYLLFGVTGSGKTEVYLNAIASVLARGEQALVLVPEIALTPQLVGRFRARFATSLAILHSGLSDGDRLAAWRAARSGEARIVLGTRSAVFVPLRCPGLIVIDEEHDPSFKQQEGFRYSARDLAIVRAQRHGIPVILGSATPSLESLARAQRQPDTILSLPQRAANAQPPRMSLVDLRKYASTQGIATPVVLAMQQHLTADGQVLLFLNRRGYAPALFCPTCGWSAQCKRCDARMTVHGIGRDIICHHCGAQQSAAAACPDCGAPAKPVGQGTQRIEETVQQLFPGVPAARIDRDSMRRKGELEATLERVDRGDIRILIGTQMLTKGHHFPSVTLVVVLNADQGLFNTDFRASERLAQTIVQVAGRAGRAERAGEVLIQTEYPDHPLLSLLLEGGYETFARGALLERQETGWPPFARIALLRAEAAVAATAIRFLQAASSAAAACGSRQVKLLGPAPAPMERRAGRYRAQLLLHADTHAPLQRLMGKWLPAVAALPEAKRVRWSIDVDPVELF